MSRFTKILFVLCLGFIGLPNAFAQEQGSGSAEANAIEVSNDGAPVVESQANVEPDLNRLVYVSIGSARAPKFLMQQFNFRPANSHDGVYEIRLVGLNSQVRISQAEVVLHNGQVYPLYRLTGNLYQGDRRRVSLSHNGVRIDSIRIWATSPNLIGSRGVFRVDLLVNH